MSFIPVNNDFLESVTLEVTPSRTFTSSSIHGVTGTISIFNDQSHILKQSNYDLLDTSLSQEFIDSDLNIFSALKNKSDGTNYFDLVQNIDTYFPKKIKPVDTSISRLQPGISKLPTNDIGSLDNKMSLLKKSFKNLNSFYQIENSQYSFTSTNYYTLNFFTSSNITNNKVLIYSTPSLVRKFDDAFDDDLYHYHGTNSTLVSPFTIDFYINPRYTNDFPNSSFHAGTILHMSSTFAISLVSGTQKDGNDLISGFRVLLQLSSSADIQPSQIDLNNLPNNVFLSDDNCLKRNNWHRVTVRWGTKYVNNGDGSVWVDNNNVCEFNYRKNLVTSYPINSQSTIFVGNFFEGSNPESLFVNSNVNKGLIPWKNGSVNTTPIFRNQLNAELHHILVTRKYLTDFEILSFSNKPKKIVRNYEVLSTNNYSGFNTSLDSNLIANFFGPYRDDILYIQPAFWPESTKRLVWEPKVSVVGNNITTTPEQNLHATNNQYNTGLQFSSLNINEINIENFLLDHSSPILSWSQPLAYNFESNCAGIIPYYQVESNIARNLLILPCDDGKFQYDSSVLNDYSQYFFNNQSLNTNIKNKLIYNISASFNDKSANNILFGNINLNFPISRSISFYDMNPDYSTVKNDLSKNYSGFYNSEDAISNKIYPLKVYNFTREDLYNKFTIFNISNLYFGKSIKENTLKIFDNFLLDNKVKITLKDNGIGNLYRADSYTKHATWAKVGNVYYNEGFITILDPTLSLFGENNFGIDFLGKQNIHVFKLAAVLPSGKLNYSNNTTWAGKDYPPNNNVNEVSPDFVYITDINFHDDNYNVVMKAKLAQPLLKKRQDKFLFKIKYDF